MPLHIGDYLADTGHLRTIEHGAYFLILMQYWRSGPLPDDDARLASIARLSRKEWSEMSPTIRAMFTSDGIILRQKRADKERAKASELSDKRRQVAEARWGAKSSKNNTECDAIAYAIEYPIAEQLDGVCISPDRSRDLNLNLPSEVVPTGHMTLRPSSNGHSTKKRSRYVPGADEPFDDFWRIYPRKAEGPVAAKKAWDRAIDSGALPYEIVAGCSRYPFDAKENGKYLPQATTWLNQGRWTTQADTLPIPATDANGRALAPDGLPRFHPSRVSPSNPQGYFVPPMSGSL